MTSKRRQELLSENKNKRTIAGHTLPSGLLSQSVALDEDQDNKMKFIKQERVMQANKLQIIHKKKSDVSEQKAKELK